MSGVGHVQAEDGTPLWFTGEVRVPQYYSNEWYWQDGVKRATHPTHRSAHPILSAKPPKVLVMTEMELRQAALATSHRATHVVDQDIARLAMRAYTRLYDHLHG